MGNINVSLNTSQEVKQSIKGLVKYLQNHRVHFDYREDTNFSEVRFIKTTFQPKKFSGYSVNMMRVSIETTLNAGYPRYVILGDRILAIMADIRLIQTYLEQEKTTVQEWFKYDNYDFLHHCISYPWLLANATDKVHGLRVPDPGEIHTLAFALRPNTLYSIYQLSTKSDITGIKSPCADYCKTFIRNTTPFLDIDISDTDEYFNTIKDILCFTPVKKAGRPTDFDNKVSKEGVDNLIIAAYTDDTQRPKLSEPVREPLTPRKAAFTAFHNIFKNL